VKYLFDSNVLIQMFKGHRRIMERIDQSEESDFGLPSIVIHEVYFGAFRSQQTAANVSRVDRLKFEVIDFDRDDARSAGEIRAALAAAGTPIGPYDILIAGQALARNLTLITHNTREFSRVPGLRIEDWEV
jgi:tRNA(fMet)-specific endonuclease VapC